MQVDGFVLAGVYMHTVLGVLDIYFLVLLQVTLLPTTPVLVSLSNHNGLISSLPEVSPDLPLRERQFLCARAVIYDRLGRARAFLEHT